MRANAYPPLQNPNTLALIKKKKHTMVPQLTHTEKDISNANEREEVRKKKVEKKLLVAIGNGKSSKRGKFFERAYSNK